MKRLLVLSFLCGTGACDPIEPGARTWADSAFGTNAVEWFTEDAAGGASMIPLLDESAVYFRREARFNGSTLVTATQLVSLDRSSGNQRWAQTAGYANNATIVGSDIAAISGGLFVGSRTTGAHRYIYAYPGRSLSGNVSSDASRFYMLTHHGRALALEAGTGAVAWDTDVAANSAAVGFGTTLAGNDLIAILRASNSGPVPVRDSGFVVVLDKATGAVRWRVTLDTIPGGNGDAGLVAPAVVSGNLAIVHTQRHRVVALNLATGALAWQFDASYGSPTMSSDGIAACDGRVIIAAGDLGLVALNAQTGAVQWKTGDIGEGSLRRIECSHGTVLVLGFGSVYDAATGNALAHYPRSRWMLSDLFVANVTRDEHSIYVATDRGFARVRAP